MNEAFKVGSVYRCNGGSIVELFNAGKSWGGDTPVLNGINLNGRAGCNNGQWLPDGRYYNGPGKQVEMSLIPGELVLRDGQWVAVEEAKEGGERFIGLDEDHDELDRALGVPASERTRPALPWADPKPFDPFPGYVVTCNTTETEGFPHPCAISPDLSEAKHQISTHHALAAVRSSGGW